MGIASKLLNELPKWGAVILVVVILSIVLIQFKDVDGVTTEINTTIDTAVAGLQEPANWTDIIVIVLVGVGVLALVIGALSYATKKKGGY
jgi:hypothetical protein